MAEWTLRRATAIAMPPKKSPARGIWTRARWRARRSNWRAPVRCPGPTTHAGHVGFYLIDKGRPELERAAKVAHSAGDRLRRAASHCPLLIYLGSVALIAGLLTGSLLTRALASGMAYWALAPLGLLALLATSQLAVALVNWLATLLVAPRPLPRMDFSEGIPGRRARWWWCRPC